MSVIELWGGYVCIWGDLVEEGEGGVVLVEVGDQEQEDV